MQEVCKAEAITRVLSPPAPMNTYFHSDATSADIKNETSALELDIKTSDITPKMGELLFALLLINILLRLE
jgi:hypothetical protein